MATSIISFPITNLNQLMVVADEYIARIFMENLTSVFEYQSNDTNKIPTTKNCKYLNIWEKFYLTKLQLIFQNSKVRHLKL